MDTKLLIYYNKIGGKIMRPQGYIAFFLITLAFLAGCVVMGKSKEYHALDASGLSRIEPGRTTASEITEIFGAPTQVVKMSNGNAYIFKHSLTKATGVSLMILSFGNYETQYDQMVFFFDTDDIMTHYGVSLKAKDASYGLPF